MAKNRFTDAADAVGLVETVADDGWGNIAATLSSASALAAV